MKRLRNQKGQMTLEMILLLSVLLGVGLTVSNYAKEQQWMKSIVSGPWQPMQGMIEDGVWVKAADSKAMHPGMKFRHGSYLGEPLN